MIQILYYFDSNEYSLIETKRSDLPSDAALSDVYKWLLFDRNSEKFEVLGFRNMIKKENCEMRSFTQGELKFDKERADFLYQGEKIHFTNGGPVSITNELKAKTTKFLLSLI